MPKSKDGYTATPALGMIERLRRAKMLIQSHLDHEEEMMKIKASLPTVAKPTKAVQKVLEARSLRKRLALETRYAESGGPKAQAEAQVIHAIGKTTAARKGKRTFRTKKSGMRSTARRNSRRS